MRNHWRSVLLSASLAAMAGAVQAAAPAGAAPAPTSGAPVPSFGTPEEAVRTLFQARSTKNGAVVKEAILVPAEKKAEVEAAVGAMVASDALQKAAAEHFGAEGKRTFDPDAATKLAAQLKALAGAKVESAADKATVALPATGDLPALVMTLQKTAEGWRIDGRSFLGAADESPDKLTARVALWQKSAAIATKMSADIAAKKYPLAGDAFRDYVKQMAEAAASVPAPATTAVATAPESQPR